MFSNSEKEEEVNLKVFFIFKFSVIKETLGNEGKRLTRNLRQKNTEEKFLQNKTNAEPEKRVQRRSRFRN